MKALSIAYYVIKRNFRDKKTLIQMMLLPIVLILILGTALGGAFTIQNIDKTIVCYLNQDEEKGPLSTEFTNFLRSDDISGIIEVKEISSYDEGAELVKSGGASAVIQIEKDFTEKMKKGEKLAIKVYSNQNSSFRTSVVQNLVDSFIDASNTIIAERKLGILAIGYEHYDSIEEAPITTEGTMPRAIDYYAVTMLVMTMMYGTIYGSFALANDRIKNTYMRLSVAPVKSMEVIIGNVFGTVATLFLQAVILIFFTKFAYKVNWGDNLLFIFFVCISIIILAVSIGMMMYSLVRNPNTTAALLSILVSVLTFISGGYMPINQLSPAFDKLCLLSPNYLAQQAMFNTIFSGSGSETQSFLIVIWTLSAGALLIASLAGRRAYKW